MKILILHGSARKKGSTGILMAYGINSPMDIQGTEYIQMAYDLGNRL